MDSTWTIAWDDFLRKIYNSPGLSFADMATMLNREFPGADKSRNAVIGRAKRLGLPGKKMTTSKPYKLRAQKPLNHVVHSLTDAGPSVKRSPKRDGVEHRLIVTECNPLPGYDGEPSKCPVTIMELKTGVCRWPLGEVSARPPYMYCGDATAPDKPYCPHHMQKMRRTVHAA